MRAVIQRVSEASVTVGGNSVARIETGLLVLVGITHSDTPSDAEWMAAKVVNMRIFADRNQNMNLVAGDVGGEILVVSQFTLHASTKKGNRPSFIQAARPDAANLLYRLFIDELERRMPQKIRTGIFGAMMDIHLINNGPVTIVIDSQHPE